MSIFLNLFLSIFVGVLWMLFVYRRDKYEPEPIKKIIFVFLLGGLAVVPAAMLEAKLKAPLEIIFTIYSVSYMLSLHLLVVGPVEELVKFFVVHITIFRKKEFNEPIDGIIYSSASSLGFATAENFIYLNRFGSSLILLRGPLTTLAHILFSMLWGYALGEGKFHPKESFFARPVNGLILAAVAHGAYNFFLFPKDLFGWPKGVQYASGVMVLVLVVILWFILMKHIRKMNLESPFSQKSGNITSYSRQS
ncbi:PrsW family intramembrane metalloprotease [bacterium]|nr:PrsW family intramembrane metalloprotease [bacterium]